MRLWSLAECGDACCTPALGPGGAVYVVTTPAWSADYLRKVRDFGDSARVEWSLFLGVASPVDKGAVVGRDGTVYAIGYDHLQKCSFLVAVDSSGTVLWKDSARVQIGGTPVIDGQNRILVADLSGGLYCYNPDGSLPWTAPTEGLCPTSTAIGIDDQVIVSTDEFGSMKAFDSHGNEQWTSMGELELEGWNTPCVTQDSTVIAFGAGSGYVYEIGDDGRALWEFSVYDSLDYARRRTMRPEGDFGSPVIGPNGDLYLTIEGGLVCIAHGGLKMANAAWPTYNHDNAHSGWAGRQQR
jgi:outer membrane protein assembly factor BamB